MGRNDGGWVVKMDVGLDGWKLGRKGEVWVGWMEVG